MNFLSPREFGTSVLFSCHVDMEERSCGRVEILEKDLLEAEGHKDSLEGTHLRAAHPYYHLSRALHDPVF